jgi:hypothetical protein
MVTLKTTSDYVILILVAACGGAIGGLAAALVPSMSPGVNKPRWLTGPIVGAVAAVVILLVLPGTKESTAVEAGHAVVTTSWSLIRVVPVALVAGWAGPKLLAVLQERLLAAGTEAKLGATVSVAMAQVENLADDTQAVAANTAKQAIEAAAGQ